MGVYGVILQIPGIRLEPLSLTATADGCECQGLKGSGWALALVRGLPVALMRACTLTVRAHKSIPHEGSFSRVKEELTRRWLLQQATASVAAATSSQDDNANHPLFPPFSLSPTLCSMSAVLHRLPAVITQTLKPWKGQASDECTVIYQSSWIHPFRVETGYRNTKRFMNCTNCISTCHYSVAGPFFLPDDHIF